MLTYKKAGVDIDKASLFKSQVASLVRRSTGTGVLRGIGGFGGLFDLSGTGFRNPVLVSSCDGVGTKLKIATLVNQHDTVGIDCVAMNVNDILCCGAKPLFFLDYIAYSRLDADILLAIVKGVNEGCSQADCSLIGGETAQMPDMYNKGEYDLAGFCVGVVEKAKIIDSSRIQAGDVLVGIESGGLHSNGFSLVRKVFSKRELRHYAKELLKPTRIYTKPILSLLATLDSQHPIIRGIAHITGGGFYGKISRVLPDNLNAQIEKNSWRVPGIFKLIQNKGNVPEKEMYRTFNMGIGMVLMADARSVPKIQSGLDEFKLKSCVIGKIVKGNKQVIID